MSKKHSVEAKKERLESHECENLCLAVVVKHGGELLETDLYWFSLLEEACLILLSLPIDGFVLESHKCFLLSGKIHLTLSHHLPKSPVWMAKKKNTGVQEQKNIPLYNVF